MLVTAAAGRGSAWLWLENLEMRRTRVARKLARFVLFVGGLLFESVY